MPYFEMVCNGVSFGNSGSPQPGDEVSKGKFFKDGKPYLNRQYFYGAYVISLDGKKPVELRSGPGMNYPVVDRVSSGVFLSMTGDMKQDAVGEWWIQIHNGSWVASKESR
jgi:Bacterial SH3 domain